MINDNYEKQMDKTVEQVKRYQESKPFTEKDLIKMTNDITQRWNARNVLNYNTKEKKSI